MSLDASKKELQRLLQNNRIAEARDVCIKLCAEYPDNVEVWFFAASLHARLGELAKVIKCCKQVISLQPAHEMAHFNLAIAYRSMGDLESAAKAFQATLLLNSGMHKAQLALGQVMMQLDRRAEAIDIYKDLLSRIDRGSADIVLNANIDLSAALCEEKRFIDAEKACMEALAIQPASAEVLNNLGNALKGRGRLKRAIMAYRKAVDVQPDFVVAYSNYLFALNYPGNMENSKIFSEHRQWGARYAALPPVKHHSNVDCNSGKVLRVGYVSPDFRWHSVILFIAALIEAHHRNNVEIFCYSDVKAPDSFTDLIRRTSDHWRETGALNDHQLATVTADDKIDILVDITGHTGHNRLLTFARKPAPVQVTWLGYPNTTGLTAIDYRLTDVWADPPGTSDKLHTESLVRLPHGFLCFQPLQGSPPVSELPMRESGNITFGSFNNSAKVNDEVIRLWSRILHSLPGSRLILKSPQLSDEWLKKWYLHAFKRQGIESHRMEIHGRTITSHDHLSLYQKVDLALDPFPYNGTTTTCEALWMGVPVVVKEGDNHAGRVGVSLLTNVGLTEFIARTNEDYVRICVELAQNQERLSKLRVGMRERLQESPLLDSDSFATDIENAYRGMWESYCES